MSEAVKKLLARVFLHFLLFSSSLIYAQVEVNLSVPRLNHSLSFKHPLSERDTILLALRFSPVVANSQGQLSLATNQRELTMGDLRPQLSDQINLSSSTTHGKTVLTQGGLGFTTKTRLGGTYQLMVQSSDTGSGLAPQITLSGSQPLLKGSGHAGNIPYITAEYQYQLQRLAYRNTLNRLVSQVVMDFWSQVLQSMTTKNTLTLKNRVERSVTAAQKKFKEGRISRSELTQNELSLAETTLETNQAQEALKNAHQRFVVSLGLPADTKMTLHIATQVESITLPSEKVAFQQAQAMNISYRTQLIALKIARENLFQAKDNMRWGLSLTGSVSRQTGPHLNPGSATQATGGIKLTIPLNQRMQHNALLSAQVNLEQSKRNIQQLKQSLLSTIKQDYNSLKRRKVAIHLAKKNEELAKRALKNNQLKLQYGRATQQEVNISRHNMLTASNRYVGAQISYLRAVEKLMDDTGTTLYFWHIKLKAPYEVHY